MCRDDESCARKYGPFFVYSVVFLITFVPFTTNTFIFIPWLTFHSQRNIYLWLAPFNLSVLLIWINYYLGCTTRPGSVKDYTPTEGFKPRWCKVCLNFKPPRSHHCRICQTCVLKMDHHCPWLNNCIGYYNHAHFVRFITSVSIGSLSCLVLIGLRIWDVVRYQNLVNSYQPYGDSFDYYTPPPSLLEISFMLVNIIILFFLLISVGILSLYQLYYASKNITTIESYEIDNISEMKESHAKAFEFPFDLGIYKNLQFMFGENLFFWWVPRNVDPQIQGNGMIWKIKKGLSMEWPPKEYYLLRRYPHLTNKILQNKNVSDSQDSQASSQYIKNMKEMKAMKEVEKFSSHVSRDSEDGYLVREWTLQDRYDAEDSSTKFNHQKQTPLVTLDSDFDSLDDSDPQDYDLQDLQDLDDLQDSDDEILGLKKYN